MEAELNGDLKYEFLPPALQRKLFSNVERLRLVQADRCDGFDHTRRLGRAPRRLPFCARQSSYYLTEAANSPNRNGKRHSRKTFLPGTSHKFREADSLQLAYLAVHADWRCFHSLPPKIQQKLFSKEEQHRFHQTQFEGRISGAAGEALLNRLEKARRCRQQPSETQSSGRKSIATSQSSTLYFDPSDSDSDSNFDTNMDNSFSDSFRWLEDGQDLDLRLDDYHAHVAKSTSSLTPRRRPSFRRTISLNPGILSRKPTSSVSRSKSQALCQSTTSPSLPANTIDRGPHSRPSSSQSQAYIPRPCTSSIDPSAHYYQDPETRLKLRVYLASPQNFDEAIEFGFPTLNNKPAICAKRTSAELGAKPHMFTGTFLDEEDEDTSVSGEKCKKRLDVMEDPRSVDLVPPSRQSLLSNREMTLKMTLTRPDLRTTESPPAKDPLKLSPEDMINTSRSGSDLWEDEQGLVSKMWRKIRRQKC